MKVRNGVLATGAVATLAAFSLLAGVAGVGAQGNRPQTQTPTDGSPHPTHIGGRVEKVDVAANTLTLATRKGSYTVSISDKTWVLTEKDGKCVEGSLADFKADQVAIVGGMTTTTPNQINARTVVQGACAKGKQGIGPGHKDGKHKGAGVVMQHIAMGTVDSVSGNTLTITSERGDKVTITTNTDTVVLSGGFKNAASIKAGDKIQALGKPAANSSKEARSIEAWGIHVVSDSSRLVVGRVEKFDGNTLTLKTRTSKDNPGTGGLTVTLDAGTAYKSAMMMDRKVTLTNAVQADVKAGSVVIVEGATASDGKGLSAKAIIVTPSVKKDKGVKP